MSFGSCVDSYKLFGTFVGARLSSLALLTLLKRKQMKKLNSDHVKKTLLSYQEKNLCILYVHDCTVRKSQCAMKVLN